MIYGYIHFSKNIDAIPEQKDAVLLYSRKNGINIESWIEIKDSKKQTKLERLKNGDILIIASLYRFGTNISQVLEIINSLIKKGVVVYSAQDDLKIGDELTNPIMMYCFDLVAKIAREQRGQQSKEGLDLLKKAGKSLGRPKGLKNKKLKLDGLEDKIEALLNKGYTKTKISKILGVSRVTLYSYLENSRTEKESVYA